ncbi:MAG: lasso peptide isopeptide bond-forming cyclase [Bacteroidota bacterium]
MSAIVGILQQDGQPVEASRFEKMHDVLTHRGPDGEGVWYGPAVALGHQMLHTTEESLRAVLPLANGDTSVVLTADARIDNRGELLADLQLPPTVTDEEIILHAYRRWGATCPVHLIGAYAFAIWDAARQRLFCARDHYGLKPFYYCHVPGQFFAFASELKALLEHPEVPRILNEMAVAEHLLAPVDVDTTITFYKDIARLAPAHSLVVTREEVKQQRYWHLDPEREIRYGSDEEYAEELRRLFAQAVACRTRSAFPVGSMLSGGLDSSSIVSVAAETASKEAPLYTYSAVFNKMQQSDERPYINMVLDKYGERLTPRMVAADQLSPLQHYADMLWHQDSAIQAGNLYFFWNLYQQARTDGVRVILDGFDGDTTLSHGIGYLHELARARKWKTLVHEVRSHAKNWGQPWKGVAWQWFREYEVAPIVRKWPAVLNARSIAKEAVRQLPRRKAPATAALNWTHMLDTTFAAGIRDNIRPQRPMARTEREEHCYLLGRPVMHRIIEVWEASAAAAGLELRLPFCDRRLLEFCLALPANQKRRDGWSRVVMRHAMDGVLPRGIQWRADKGNLGPSFDHGLLVKAKEELQQMMDGDTGAISRFVDLDMLHKTHPEFKQESMDNYTVYHWRALSLALWLQYTGL